MKPIRAFGNALPAEVDRKEGKSGERCRAGSSWADRLRSPAGERGLVFRAGASGAVARRKYYIFFSWMNLPSQRLRQAEETKITALHRS